MYVYEKYRIYCLFDGRLALLRTYKYDPFFIRKMENIARYSANRTGWFVELVEDHQLMGVKLYTNGSWELFEQEEVKLDA